MKKGKNSGKNNGLLPNSLRIISSCIKTVSSNATSVASSVRSSISNSSDDHKDQVTWVGFDKLELSPSTSKRILLLGYQNGFQVLDVDDASNFVELVSKREGPVTFLQMQPIPAKSDSQEGFRASHPLLLVVAVDESNSLNLIQNRSHLAGVARDGSIESQSINSPTAVRFYSLRSHSHVHILRFRSAVCMVRCSPRVVAVGLATQIYCFDALTLENKFSVLTYPVPQVGGQGTIGVNIGCGPMAVGPRWLAYASNNPLLSNSGRLSPQNLTPSPGVSPSTSPGSGSLVARYAMESSKHLAAGIINLGDMGYKTLSKYCQDLLPDGSTSPVSPSSSWKSSRLSAAEAENAGMVAIKDFVSRAVVSQFKAHTSPISALCFDPSGTLLVTASVHGNNINIFRIMPSCMNNASGTQNFDWSSSHVHLYKLYRGITTAIIQDICFSHYSQWVAIVSSKGTCHIFVLSPFGGDIGFQTMNSHGEEPSLFPVLSLPWWSSSSCVLNQQSFPPPPPVSLSVVSRIKDSNSGWLNTVSNAAASASGKISVPSGAVAAVFHDSTSHSYQHANARANSLEHLLVYTPTGHVVQHELLPSIRDETGDNAPRNRSGSVVQIQDEDLRVKVHPIQWWDVCRRSDWPEREESVSGVTYDRLDSIGRNMNYMNCEGSETTRLLATQKSVNQKILVKSDSLKSQDRSHWYLSNAEVQINSGTIPVWQKSKISFFVMTLPRETKFGGGEFEIEKVLIHEVEIRRKDLLPVFDHFHGNDRGLARCRSPTVPPFEPLQAKDKVMEETMICHSNPASLSSTESSDGGSSRRIENLLDLDQFNSEKLHGPTFNTLDGSHQRITGSSISGYSNLNEDTLIAASFPSEQSKTPDFESEVIDNHNIDSLSMFNCKLPSVGRALVEESLSLNSRITNIPMFCDDFDSKMNFLGEEPTPSEVKDPPNFGQLFQEEYCKASEQNESCGLPEAMTDDLDSSSSHCEKEKPEDNGENDEMLGGIFTFSEEG
ncbi:BCAS3 domain [Dillenia turbinata]|uniref:BCAS3 domain n=1 Tax=Dillenia turbinata TaxID=194707 RepID=A0AAN8VLU9_9MAGN